MKLLREGQRRLGHKPTLEEYDRQHPRDMRSSKSYWEMARGLRG